MPNIDPYMPSDYYAYERRYWADLDATCEQALAEVEAERALLDTAPATATIQ